MAFSCPEAEKVFKVRSQVESLEGKDGFPKGMAAARDP